MRKTILSLACAVAILSACEKVSLNTPTANQVNSLKATDTILIIAPIDSTVVVPPVAVPPYVKQPIVIAPVVVPPYVINTPIAIGPVVVPPYAIPPVVSHSPVVVPPIVTPPVVVPPVVKPPVVVPPVVTPPVVVPPVVKPPVVVPPVVTPPVIVPPVVKPPVVVPPVVVPPVVTPPVTGLSFAKDVMPVLSMCQGCHNHGWTASTVASTYYTNLVNSGYVNPASYTSSAIYLKLSSGHPGAGNISAANTNKIINWMIQGSKNN